MEPKRSTLRIDEAMGKMELIFGIFRHVINGPLIGLWALLGRGGACGVQVKLIHLELE